MDERPTDVLLDGGKRPGMVEDQRHAILDSGDEVETEAGTLTIIPVCGRGDVPDCGLAEDDKQALVVLAQSPQGLAPGEAIGIWLGDAIRQHGSMPSGNGDRVRVSGDAVPDIGKELEAILGWKPKDLVSECVRSHSNKLRVSLIAASRAGG